MPFGFGFGDKIGGVFNPSVTPPVNPELFPDPYIADAANFAAFSGSGSFSAAGNRLTLNRTTSSLIGLNATAANELLADLSDSTLYTVILEIGNFVSFTNGIVCLKSLAGQPLFITGDGLYPYSVTSGTSAITSRAWCLNSLVGQFDVLSISVKLP